MSKPSSAYIWTTCPRCGAQHLWPADKPVSRLAAACRVGKATR